MNLVHEIAAIPADPLDDAATAAHFEAWLSRQRDNERDGIHDGVRQFLRDADNAEYWLELGWTRIMAEARLLNYITAVHSGPGIRCITD